MALGRHGLAVGKMQLVVAMAHMLVQSPDAEFRLVSSERQPLAMLCVLQSSQYHFSSREGGCSKPAQEK